MSISSFEIISVPVSDQERAKRFYRDTLGFELLREDSAFTPRLFDHDCVGDLV